MTLDQIQRLTFEQGSTTFFNSSLFFPLDVRRDVFTLYSFVRTADDMVDTIPQRTDDFYRFRDDYTNALQGHSTHDLIIHSFIDLMCRKGFNPQWVESFLNTMELDLTKQVYSTIEETLDYMYGSAEVIGLFMAKILNLPPEAYMYARLQGRAMQYINFIRDVEEDRQLGRVYLPLADSGITSLEHRHALIERDAFTDFIHVQIGRYRQWQAEAKKGFRYIPVRYLIPIKTASDMYSWTARKIELDPFIIYYTKVKPRRSQVRLHAFSNAIRIRRIKKRSYRDSLYLLE